MHEEMLFAAFGDLQVPFLHTYTYSCIGACTYTSYTHTYIRMSARVIGCWLTVTVTQSLTSTDLHLPEMTLKAFEKSNSAAGPDGQENRNSFNTTSS